MKKIVRNLALLLVPIVLYYTIFIIFEPNNYFGLHKSATGTNIIATLRNYQKHPTEGVILGDSRLAKVDLTMVDSISEIDYTNLSYGGASLKEQLDILNWSIEKNPDLKQVIFLVSFYTLNKSYSHDRQVIEALNNPFVYMTNLGYNINMLTEVYYKLTGTPTGAAEETMNPADYTYTNFTVPSTGQTVEMRETLAKHLAEIDERCAKWELDQPTLDTLIKTISLCEKKGISFVTVLPPDHPDVYEYIVKPYGIDAPMQEALVQLRETSSLVLDYEFSANGLTDEQFYDCFHLDTERGLPQWTQQLFTDIEVAESS